jgi:hypothetical protein
MVTYKARLYKRRYNPSLFHDRTDNRRAVLCKRKQVDKRGAVAPYERRVHRVRYVFVGYGQAISYQIQTQI